MLGWLSIAYNEDCRCRRNLHLLGFKKQKRSRSPNGKAEGDCSKCLEDCRHGFTLACKRFPLSARSCYRKFWGANIPQHYISGYVLLRASHSKHGAKIGRMKQELVLDEDIFVKFRNEWKEKNKTKIKGRGGNWEVEREWRMLHNCWLSEKGT